MKGFRFLPHSVTSDIAFEATGRSLKELFENSARATFSVMADLAKVKPKIKSIVKMKAPSLEDLLFNFLNELIFIKDRDGMLFSKFNVTIKDANLAVSVFGEKIDPEKHDLGVDVKAVTKHDFSMVKKSGIYKARVVLDI